MRPAATAAPLPSRGKAHVSSEMRQRRREEQAGERMGRGESSCAQRPPRPAPRPGKPGLLLARPRGRGSPGMASSSRAHAFHAGRRLGRPGGTGCRAPTQECRSPFAGGSGPGAAVCRAHPGSPLQSCLGVGTDASDRPARAPGNVPACAQPPTPAGCFPGRPLRPERGGRGRGTLRVHARRQDRHPLPLRPAGQAAAGHDGRVMGPTPRAAVGRD